VYEETLPAGLMTHQYKKLPVTMKMWMQFNVMPRTVSSEWNKRRDENENVTKMRHASSLRWQEE